MSDEWGLDSENDNPVFPSVGIDEEGGEYEDSEPKDKGSNDEVAQKVAEKVKERIEEKAEESAQTGSDASQMTTQQSGNVRFEVTLRKAINAHRLNAFDTDDYLEQVGGVMDVELLEEAAVQLEDGDKLNATLDRIQELGDRSTDHLMVDGEYRYMPVFGFNINHVCTVPYRDADADDYEFDSIWVGDALLSWWEENAITPRHQYVLVNPIDAVKNTNHVSNDVPFREIFRFAKGEQLVISDSGGFQIVSRDNAGRVDDRKDHVWTQERLHPLEVLDWQVENADAGTILDHPPYVTEGESSIFNAEDEDQDEWLDELFEPFLEKTAENAEAACKYLEELREEGDRRAEDFKLLGVIQGHTYDKPDAPCWEMLRRWHEKVDKAGEYDGWALSPTPCTSLGQIAMHLAFAHNNCDEKWLHVLQVGSSVNIALIQFYAMLSDKFVTSDASSHNRGSKYRQFVLPPGYGRSLQITDREDRFERHPCNCQVCKTVEETYGFEYIGDDADSKRNATINLHNLTMQLQSQRILDSLMRAEGEDVIAGLKATSTGDIERFISPFWKQLKDVTTKSKIRDLYAAMLYLFCSVKNGMKDKHTIYIKRPEYRDVDEGEDERVKHERIQSLGTRGEEGGKQEWEEEEEEENDVSAEEEMYLSLDIYRFNEPSEDVKRYYYQHTVRIDKGMQEATLNPTSDSLDQW